ncbi:MAG: hypothetical protein JNJ80_20375 [Gemmatimonadetes bacterium]|nr:hypothetical protein [Gemmatimonadota bacterium]MCC7131367.1 hypothetical protein [Gemmatimonadales bacterium]
MIRSTDPTSSLANGDELLNRIEQALAKGVREALLRHKLAGNPVAAWRDGRVIWVAAAEIPVDQSRSA